MTDPTNESRYCFHCGLSDPGRNLCMSPFCDLELEESVICTIRLADESARRLCAQLEALVPYDLWPASPEHTDRLMNALSDLQLAIQKVRRHD